MRAHANQEFQSGALVQSGPAPRLLVRRGARAMMVAEELRDAGFPVLEAAHADEAIDMLRHAPGIKLMISDIRMASQSFPQVTSDRNGGFRGKTKKPKPRPL